MKAVSIFSGSIFVFICFVSSISAQNFPNESLVADWNMVFDENWQDKSDWGNPFPEVVQNQAGDPISPPSAMRWHWPIGSFSHGAGSLERLVPQRFPVIYSAMSFKLEGGYNISANGGAKFMFFQSEPGAENRFMSHFFGPGSSVDRTGPAEFGGGAELAAVPGGTLISQPFIRPTLASVPIELGRWYIAEVIIKVGSSYTAKDGEYHVWITDDKGTTVKTIQKLGLPSGPSPINFFKISFMMGDANSNFTRTRDHYIYVGHWRVRGTQSLQSTFSSIAITPDKITLPTLATQQFKATALDQYGQPMASQPTFAWAASGGGSINSTGLLTAGSSAGGPFTVTASANGKTGTVQFDVGSAVGTNAFLGTYFKNMDLTEPVLTRIDQAINFNWAGSAPDPSVPTDSFSVRWEGDFNFPAAGTYPFTARADDGIRIYMDGNIILNQWKRQVATTYTVNQAVTAGTHRVKVEYYDYKYDAVAQVSFLGTAQVKSTRIPPAERGLSVVPVRNAGTGLEFRVSHHGTDPFSLQISDVSGKKVWESRNTANVQSVFCGNLSVNGLYFVTLKQGNSQIIRKMALVR